MDTHIDMHNTHLNVGRKADMLMDTYRHTDYITSGITVMRLQTAVLEIDVTSYDVFF